MSSGAGGGDGLDVVAARRARLAALRSRMEILQVDALVLSHGADLPWLTGYRAMPLERLSALVVTRDADPLLVVPGLEAPKVPDPKGLFELRPWGETEDPIAIVCAALAGSTGSIAGTGSTGGGIRTVGVSDRAWSSTLLALQERLEGCRFVASSMLSAPLRALKDQSEVAALRAAAAAADRVARALQEGEVRLAGRSEAEVSSEIAARLVSEGHSRVNFAIVASGSNGASPHHDAGERVISGGDLVVCDFGGELSLDGSAGYCSDITRTLAVGEPLREVRDAYEVLAAAQRAGVAAARAGVPAGEVDAAARKVIEEAGLGKYFIHRTGHGIGLEEHEHPYIVEGNDMPLEVGNAFSVEPGIYVEGRFGMRLEDIVVVTGPGSEVLNQADHALVVVDT